MKQKIAVSKRAMTEKRERWQGKELDGRPKSRWQQPEVTAVRVRTIRGTSLILKESGEKSYQKWTQWERERKYKYVENAVKKVRKEKTNCTRWLRLQS